MSATRLEPVNLGEHIFQDGIEEQGLICDSGRDAVAAMIKRLAHRNANVQLYTLEVSFPHQAQPGSD